MQNESSRMHFSTSFTEHRGCQAYEGSLYTPWVARYQQNTIQPTFRKTATTLSESCFMHLLNTRGQTSMVMTMSIDKGIAKRNWNFTVSFYSLIISCLHSCHLLGTLTVNQCTSSDAFSSVQSSLGTLGKWCLATLPSFFFSSSTSAKCFPNEEFFV